VLLFMAGVPVYYGQLQTVCTAAPCFASLTVEEARAIEAAGLSLRFVAGYSLALEALLAAVCAAVAAINFWRRPAEPMAWHAAVMLATFGTFGVQDVDKVEGVLWAKDNQPV
jgi:hypothetical protein